MKKPADTFPGETMPRQPRATFRLTPLAPVLVLTAALAACTQYPEVLDAETPGLADAAYPRLLPLETLLSAPEPRATFELRAATQGRVDALRARAARLSGPVLDAPTKARLQRGVRQPG